MAIVPSVSGDEVANDREYSLLWRAKKRVRSGDCAVVACLCGSSGKDFHAGAVDPTPSLAKSYRDRNAFLRFAWGAGVLEDEAYFSTRRGVVCLEFRLTDVEADMVGSPMAGYLGRARDYVESWLALDQSSTVAVLRSYVPLSLYDKVTSALLRATQEKVGHDTTAAISAVSFAKKHFEDLYNRDEVVLGGSLTLGAALMGVECVVAFMALGKAKVLRVVPAEEDEEEHDFESDDDGEVVNECGDVIARRVPATEIKELRSSIKIKPLSEADLDKEAQLKNKCPKGEEEVVRSCDRLIGPPIFPATASLDTDDARTEMSGVNRHLNITKQLSYSEPAMALFEEAVALVSEVLLGSVGDSDYSAELPKVWTPMAKDDATAQIAEERPHMLGGFAKSKEVGLPLEKDARLIGTLGMNDCAANAMGVSLVEQHFKKKFPGAVTKGLSAKDLDTMMAARLQQFSGYSKQQKALGLYSIDFSAMDSSWKPHEKQAINDLVKKLACLLADNLHEDILTHDPMLDADADKGIYWRLRHFLVQLDIDDAILFSGERGTSLFNRLLVLVIRTAELLRLHGREAAKEFWQSMQTPTCGKYQDTGDGDDSAFNNPGYADVAEAITAYKAYAKWIEPVRSDGHCMEVLSRFTTILEGRAYHLAKLGRNTERMVIGCYGESVAGVPMTGAEHAMTARNLIERARSCKQTMFLGHYARALAKYHIDKAATFGVQKAAVSHDLSRLGDALQEAVGADLSLADAYEELVDDLEEASTSGYAMVEWTHFGKEMPKTFRVKQLVEHWVEAQDVARELEITDADFADPVAFVERMGLRSSIRSALKIKAKPLAAEVLLDGRSPPSSAEVGPADILEGIKDSRHAHAVEQLHAKRASDSESAPVPTQRAGGATTSTDNVKFGDDLTRVAHAVGAGIAAFQEAQRAGGKGKGKGKGKHDDKSAPRKGAGPSDGKEDQAKRSTKQGWRPDKTIVHGYGK